MPLTFTARFTGRLVPTIVMLPATLKFGSEPLTEVEVNVRFGCLFVWRTSSSMFLAIFLRSLSLSDIMPPTVSRISIDRASMVSSALEAAGLSPSTLSVPLHLVGDRIRSWASLAPMPSL